MFLRSLLRTVLFISTIATVLTISACTFSRTYLDRAEDVQEGKAFVNNFYNNILDKKYDAVDLLTSDTLVSVVGKNGVSKIVKLINRKAGNYKSYLIVDSNTVRTEGSNENVIYRFKVKVTYEDGVVDEMIGLEKLEGSGIKVMSYHANSDLLMR